jgi:hypothetical protein
MTKRVGGEPVRDTAILDWRAELLTTIVGAADRARTQA